MGTILLIGLLLPVVYLMQLVKNKKPIDFNSTKKTVIISIVGVLLTTMLFFVFSTNHTSFWLYFIGTLIIAVIWALLLCACYYFYQVLSNNVKK